MCKQVVPGIYTYKHLKKTFGRKVKDLIFSCFKQIFQSVVNVYFNFTAWLILIEYANAIKKNVCDICINFPEILNKHLHHTYISGV